MIPYLSDDKNGGGVTYVYVCMYVRAYVCMHTVEYRQSAPTHATAYMYVHVVQFKLLHARYQYLHVHKYSSTPVLLRIVFSQGTTNTLTTELCDFLILIFVRTVIDIDGVH